MDSRKPTVCAGPNGAHTDSDASLAQNDSDRGPRTQPPTGLIDPHRRFSQRADDDVPECSRCESATWDLWMTEGATSIVARCVGCGRVVGDGLGADPRDPFGGERA